MTNCGGWRVADRGMIFSAPMVRALLDERKTQTRRLLKPAPFVDEMGNFCARDRKGTLWNWGQNIDGSPCVRNYIKRCGYAPGQQLYVRECWHVRGRYSDVVEIGFRASETRGHTEYVEQIPNAHAVPGKGKWPEFPKYGPSIHMPRWASRLTLGVADVRVQRLQDISEADAVAEGLIRYTLEGPGGMTVDAWHWLPNIDDDQLFNTAVAAYRALWNSLHTKPGGTWTDNPWVVAVSFDVARRNIDATAA